MKTLGAHVATMIRETTPRFQTKTVRWQASRPFHKHEEYVRRCLVSAGEVIAACEQMAHATELLTGYRRSSKAARVPLSRYEYVTYHIENHLIRAISVLDRSLVLVNIVFRLGLRNEDCRFNTIIGNEHVSHTKTATALRALDKFLKPLRRPRNVVIHHRQHDDPLFESVVPFYVLQKGDMARGGSDPLIVQYASLSRR